MRNARDEALEMVEEGIVSAQAMLEMALAYMSTDEVSDMLDANELSERFREDHAMVESLDDLFEGDDDNALEEDF
jgi:hypothetical protein